ncbi:MAG: hypothetical protein P8102_06120 [Gammaproteobacteria bacterium]
MAFGAQNPNKEITVKVKNFVNGPAVTLADPVQDGHVKFTGPLGSGPKIIRWKLDKDSEPGWDLVSIEFSGNGLDEFEQDGVQPDASNKKQIQIKDKFVTEGAFKYTIWCAPEDGFGRPISLDPIIENRPPR